MRGRWKCVRERDWRILIEWKCSFPARRTIDNARTIWWAQGGCLREERWGMSSRMLWVFSPAAAPLKYLRGAHLIATTMATMQSIIEVLSCGAESQGGEYLYRFHLFHGKPPTRQQRRCQFAAFVIGRAPWQPTISEIPLRIRLLYEKIEIVEADSIAAVKRNIWQGILLSLWPEQTAVYSSKG